MNKTNIKQMTLNYKELKKRRINIKKFEQALNMYNTVLRDVKRYIENDNEIDPVRLEIDINNLKAIEQILLLP